MFSRSHLLLKTSYVVHFAISIVVKMFIVCSYYLFNVMTLFVFIIFVFRYFLNFFLSSFARSLSILSIVSKRQLFKLLIFCVTLIFMQLIYLYIYNFRYPLNIYVLICFFFQFLKLEV